METFKSTTTQKSPEEILTMSELRFAKSAIESQYH